MKIIETTVPERILTLTEEIILICMKVIAVTFVMYIMFQIFSLATIKTFVVYRDEICALE